MIRARRHARPAAALRPALTAAVIETVESRLLMALPPVDIEGVYNASIDQPRTYALLQRDPNGDPLFAIDPMSGTETFTIEAFYDTGASGVLLSKETADAMGVERATYNGEDVLFADVGVGGASFFEVSEPLHIALAPYGVERDLDNFATFEQVYDQRFGPLRTQISLEEAGLLGFPVDVFGMPTMAGKVIVMDARPPSSDEDLGVMRTYTYNPGRSYNAAEDENDPGIPRTNFHVDLSYAHFDRFTEVIPEGAPGPTLRYNPFIGPNPLLALDPALPPDNTPPLVVSHGSRSFAGSWLFDTGAAASILSQHGAEAVGVRYVDGTFGTEAPRLEDAQGNELDEQFTLQIGGVGGSLTAAGFFLDSMVLPTQEGQPIRYLRAPVLVADISVADPVNGEELTLDGVFGMNFLVASMYVDGTELGDVAAGAYDWLVFDEPNGVLGLNIPGIPSEPSVVGRQVLYDNGTVAPDKVALLPGQRATFQNFTSTSSGITGIMLDVNGLANAAGVGADDFVVRMGNSDDPSTWGAAPAPGVTVQSGGGAGGTDRVTLRWADNQVKNKWVQVTVKANADTGLAQQDVFYFGNLAGDTGDHSAAATFALVNSADLGRTREHLAEPAGPESPFDHRRDGRVNAIDLATIRANHFRTLRLITAPATSAPAAAGAAAAGEVVATADARPLAPPSRRRVWYDEFPDVLGREV